jgi:hypothetical protein
MTNEKLYFSKGLETLLQQIIHGAIQVDKKKNIVQFAFIFHLLKSWSSHVDYITMQKLFVQLNVPNNLMKHWSNGVGWEMTILYMNKFKKKFRIWLLGSFFL